MGPVECEERERLNAVYLSALDKHSQAGRYIADRQSEEWRRATTETRRECYEALAALDAHKKEHGCSNRYRYDAL